MNPIKPRTLFIFPGQGAQYQGMGRDLDTDFPAARRIYDRASEALGCDMRELSFSDPLGRLATTEFTQVALLTHSVACWEVFRDLIEDQLQPMMTGGHSLGEYAALVAAGALSFEAALKLVQKRGQLMGKYGVGKMVAVKLDVKTVRSFAHLFYCDVGGCNLPDQTVVGGAESDLSSFVAYVKETFGIRSYPLNTEGAFHTFHMTEAAQLFRPILDAVELRPPAAKVLSNYTGQYHPDNPNAIKPNLFYQLFHPVKWIWGIKFALREGINCVVEFGGGLGSASGPEEKRPNLESITRRTIKESGHNALYVPAINSATIRGAAQIIQSLGAVSDQPRDSEANSVDENWFHLFLPLDGEMLTRGGEELVRLIGEQGLGHVVQVVGASVSEEPEPRLEMVAGCETGALVAYTGEEIVEELVKLKARLKNPGYLSKRIIQVSPT